MINGLLTLLGVIALSIVGREAAGWIWQLSLWVARRAAAAMPGRLAEEYEDIYLGDLETLRDRPLTAVIVSLRMLKGSRQTASIRVSGRPSPAALAKTVINFTAALLLIVVLAPVMMVTGAAIFLIMGSPVVLRQERLGKGGSTFHLLKFRTMEPDRRVMPQDFFGEGRRQTHRHPHDPRINRLGRFLRRWSLDELPQLWNVVRGEMSLVGPRPWLPFEKDTAPASTDPVHDVRPGITGWWKVGGIRRRGRK